MRWEGIWIGMILVSACGKDRRLPEPTNSNAGWNGATPTAVRGFEALSSAGKVRLTVFEGPPRPAEPLLPVGTLKEWVRHSIPREGPTGVPVIEEWVEALPSPVPVYFAGGGSDPLQLSAFVESDQAARVRTPLLRSVRKEFSRAVTFCGSFSFKGAYLLRTRPVCQSGYYCTLPNPGAYSCSLTGQGEPQCLTGDFRLYQPGAPEISRDFYAWMRSEDQAFVCQDWRVGFTTPVVLTETDRVERLEWSIRPGVELSVRMPNPVASGEPWIVRPVRFSESLLGFSWDK